MADVPGSPRSPLIGEGGEAGSVVLSRRRAMRIAAGVALLVVLLVVAIALGVWAVVGRETGGGSSPDGDGDDGGGTSPGPAPPPPSAAELRDALVAGVDAEPLRAFMEKLSAMPHEAGSVEDEATANWLAEELRATGAFDWVDIEPLELLLPQWVADGRLVQLVAGPGAPFNASLVEPPIPGVNSTFVPAPPVWGGWSAPGDVTGPLVYANYGSPSDFALLDELLGGGNGEPANLTGCVVMARYGLSFRADMTARAVSRGAAALLVFTDAAVWGYLRGPVFPEGPWATNATAQRGTFWRGNGDPLTPGWPSEAPGTAGAPRLPLSDAFGTERSFDGIPLPSIPVQPLAWQDAAPLLAALAGSTPLPPDPAIRAAWRGALNITTVGPGPARVRVRVGDGVRLKTIWNVAAGIRGSVEPDRYVVCGAHRDAWTFGAGDPISGSTALIGAAHGLAALRAAPLSWTPRRSIAITSWDAEEEGLIGSAEFVEGRFRQLQNQAVAYLNLDVAVAGMGQFAVAGTPAFHDAVRRATEAVSVEVPAGPMAGPRSVYEMWSVDGARILPLGTGSDYTPFIQHAGVPSIDLRFQATPGGARAEEGEANYESVYHSNYDCFDWYLRFGDPDFNLHVGVARVFGLLLLDMVDAEVVPLEYTPTAVFLNASIDTLRASAAAVPALAANLSWTRMDAALARFTAAAAVSHAQRADAASLQNDALALRALNDRLMQVERAFLVPYQPQEVTGSNWFAHAVVSPSPSNSYAGAVFNGIASVITAPGATVADVEFIIGRTAQIVDAAANVLGGHELARPLAQAAAPTPNQ